MLILESLEYSLSPAVKLLVCLIIGFAIFIVFLSNPGKSKKKGVKPFDSNIQYTEIDPADLVQGKSDWLQPDLKKRSAVNSTLEHLDEYVKTLKRHHIRNLDGV